MKHISVFPEEKLRSYSRLFSALEEIYPVRFVPDVPAARNGAIFFGEHSPAAEVPSLMLPQEDVGRRISFSKLQFTGHRSLHPAFRGKSFSGAFSETGEVNDSCSTGEPIAAVDGRPVWTVAGSPSGREIFRAFLCVPRLSESDYVFQWFNPESFASLLPLFQFVRSCGADLMPEKKIYANIMFDDPNLHWKSYGFIDFQQLAAHAADNSYHASFATVPIDSYYVNRRAARIFQENRRTMSLLIHGYRHSRRELASLPPEVARVQLADGLRRIERLESEAKLKVSRVMAAPHGACSLANIAVLEELGYDAACISRGSLIHYNPGISWPASVGLRHAIMVRRFPVIPRFRISFNCTAAISLAAFLDQPIIPVGHHDDLQGGLDLLAKVASEINSLDGVSWCSMAEIAAQVRCATNGASSSAEGSFVGAFPSSFEQKGRRFGAWPFVRRGLVEVRDRTRPLIAKAFRIKPLDVSSRENGSKRK